MGDIEVLGVVDLEVDADVGVYGLARSRSVAGALLERAGTTKLLDSVGAVLVELCLEGLEQPPNLFSELVSLFARQGELVGDVVSELFVSQLDRDPPPDQVKMRAKISPCSIASSRALWVCSREERSSAGRSPRPASETVTPAFCW